MYKDLQNLISHLKENGFIYQSSEIYGGLANSFDYGPIGTMLKDNLKYLWKKYFITSDEKSFLFDSSIILNNKVWNASGHLDKFNDYMIECLTNNKRYRIDKLVKEYLKKDINNLSLKEIEELIKKEIKLPESIAYEFLKENWKLQNDNFEKKEKIISEINKILPKYLNKREESIIRLISGIDENSNRIWKKYSFKEISQIFNITEDEIFQIESEAMEKLKNKTETRWGEIKAFNLMFKINSSKTGNDQELYLRPETAQGIFINFKNLQDSLHLKLPFSIGQIGKSFRNEVTPGNFIFKTREFEQLELEQFIFPNENRKAFNKISKKVKNFLTKELNLNEKHLYYENVKKEELAHYSKKTLDINYNFPFGKGELLGIADRGDFDLKNHAHFSKQNLFYQEQNKKIVPNIIETSMGVERLLFAILIENYNKEKNKISFPYNLAPYKIAICPLTKNEIKDAKKIFNKIIKKNLGEIILQESGSIGKRYFRQDAIGTPFVITIDKKYKEDKTFTIRHWDNKKQERIKFGELTNYIKKNAK